MSKDQRIAILTSGPLCRNPRVLKEAQTLGAAGFDVTVLTVANQEKYEAYDREILLHAPYQKQVVDQIPRAGRPPFRATVSRLATWIARRVVRWGLESGQALGPHYELKKLVASFPADLTIVHTELPLCIGCELLASGRRVATDFEDWHSQDLLPEAQRSRPLNVLRRAERELMQHSAYTSTTSSAMARALQEAYAGELPLVLANSFPLQATPSTDAIGVPPAFFWFSQTIGPGRGLELFIAAWRQTKQPSRLCLLGEVSQEYREKLQQRTPENRRTMLEFLPVTSPDLLPGVIARHDIGLALEPSIPTNKDLTISNKILQYLNAGLAVIASGTAGQREVLARAPEAGRIITLSETTALAHELDELLSSPLQLKAMRAAARRAAETTYCWEKDEPRLVAAVTSALASKPPTKR